MANLAGLTIVSISVYCVARCIYLLFFHPLSKYPGPRLAAISGAWKTKSQASGAHVFEMQDLHRKYGDIVRIGPNSLSFATAEAYRDIYGHVTAGKKKFLKSSMYEREEPRITSVRDPVVHAQQRKALSNAFSAKALRDQEDVVHQYVDLMVEQLGKFGAGGQKPVNATDAYNWLTFDIIGDLAFGEPFGALAEGSNYWVDLVLDSVLFGTLAQRMKNKPWDRWMIPFIWGREWNQMQEKYDLNMSLAKEKARKRIEMGDSLKRQDFFGHLIKKNEINEMNLLGNAITLIVAGSETTATALIGTTWYLLKHPHYLATLTEEVRSTFSSPEEITGDATAKCQYLHAVIEEGLRVFPPVSAGLPRDCPGAAINGEYIPAGVTVSCENYSMSRDPRYWEDADSFRPERWLSDEFGDDKRAFQPFSTGPRACLGINLAYLEMRVTLAKVLFAYDLTLVSQEIEDWNHACKSYGLWKKADLLVKFHPRKTA
ncbi:Isotrichodermin C-15 hydroxylase [Cytospora mali]|uniref:Isotrichodermin C-15 hydroxylase n=1 Tax=Cytospora mali TaxID=578113 RepID=A0A194V8J5_CYTMA|nr:Isotrichodermin C-15 hydroxylase [Valsa mali var. pyri (nom. inval.)]